jgi:hypothetical protein
VCQLADEMVNALADLMDSLMDVRAAVKLELLMVELSDNARVDELAVY